MFDNTLHQMGRDRFEDLLREAELERRKTVVFDIDEEAPADPYNYNPYSGAARQGHGPIFHAHHQKVVAVMGHGGGIGGTRFKPGTGHKAQGP